VIKLLSTWLCVFVAGFAGAALAKPVQVDAVEVELVADRAALAPGQPLKLGLRIRHDPHWHTYWRNPGDSGLPTQLTLSLPPGFSAGDIQWPAPERIRIGPLANFGYEGEIVLPVAIAVPSAVNDPAVDFRAHAQWLVCKDVCIPGEARLDLNLPVQRTGTPPPSPTAGLFDAMLRRSPQGSIDVAAEVRGNRLALAFDGGEASRVDFFPYAETLISNPARQALSRIGDAAQPRSRLDVVLADGVVRATIEKAGFFSVPAGVLVTDGVAREVRARPVESLPAGTAVVNAADNMASGAYSSASPSGGLLAGSRSGPAAFTSGARDSMAASTLSGALVFAMIGGLILNLMPCVFPVVGLKLLGFAGEGARGSRAARLNATVFAAGVVVSFWVLAVILLGLRATGEAAGWGFQLQSPTFVVAMAMLFVAIGLNLSGVFEFGTRLTRLGGIANASTSVSAFASGVLAVLVATPCSAPFMGTALGYTLGQSTLEALLVFTAIGIGMALPYLLLGWFPAWQRWLPKPGRWTESLRQFLAFPMYATAAWLAWVLGQQVGIDAVLGLAIGAVLLAMSAWIYGRFVQVASTYRVPATTAALLAAAVAVYLAIAPAARDAATGTGRSERAGADRAASAGASDWEAWSEQRVNDAIRAGQPVFVDFTAAWCVSCQVNERLVLAREPVAAEMARRKVLKLRADWTQRDPAITAALAKYGRNGVPLYLMFVPGEAVPRVLPELLTSGIVLDTLNAVTLALNDRENPGLIRR
jgi:thiol:disulfide interchange protein/DsbC/DsbD-like thiol-disulfide interchange protein